MVLGFPRWRTMLSPNIGLTNGTSEATFDGGGRCCPPGARLGHPEHLRDWPGGGPGPGNAGRPNSSLRCATTVPIAWSGGLGRERSAAGTIQRSAGLAVPNCRARPVQEAARTIGAADTGWCLPFRRVHSLILWETAQPAQPQQPQIGRGAATPNPAGRLRSSGRTADCLVIGASQQVARPAEPDSWLWFSFRRKRAAVSQLPGFSAKPLIRGQIRFVTNRVAVAVDVGNGVAGNTVCVCQAGEYGIGGNFHSLWRPRRARHYAPRR